MKNMGLRKKITVLVLGSVLAILLLCFLLFTALFFYQGQTEVRNTIQSTKQRIESRINSYLREIDMASNTVMFSTWVQKYYVSSPRTSDTEKRNNYLNAERFLSCFSSMYGDLNCLILFDNGDILKSNSNDQINTDFIFSEQEWYSIFQDEGIYRIFGRSDVFRKSAQVREDSVTTYYVIKSIYASKEIGYFVVNFDYDTFKFIAEELSEQEGVLITDASQNIIYTNLTENDQTHLLEEEDTTDFTSTSNYAIYHGEILSGALEIWIQHNNASILDCLKKNSVLFLMLLPLAMFFTCMALIFSNYLTNPIVLCTNALHEIRNENYNIQIPNPYHAEIGDMIDGFNDMSANIQHLLDMNKAMYAARQETEFRILQQRINPHFLRNTLEIINGMILCEETNKALELTGMLGQMYRYDLGETDIATFQEELNYLKNYLSILAYKYRDLKVYYTIDERVLPCRIPKFICQPLVENTLKHGFHSMIENCILEISIQMKGDQIEIQITDNGHGFDPELLDQIQQDIEHLREDQTISFQEHIGMLNTARRLFLRYGHACQFSIYSKQEEGSRIDIILPVGEKSLMAEKKGVSDVFLLHSRR